MKTTARRGFARAIEFLRKGDGQGFDTACVAAIPAYFQDCELPAL